MLCSIFLQLHSLNNNNNNCLKSFSSIIIQALVSCNEAFWSGKTLHLLYYNPIFHKRMKGERGQENPILWNAKKSQSGKD